MTARPRPPFYLDLATWPRRASFEHFGGFDQPYFNVCTRLDVARSKQALADARAGSLMLACHFLALRAAAQIEPMRYRLEAGRVRVHEAVHGSTTVLRDDGSIGFAPLPAGDDFAAFMSLAGAAVGATRRGEVPFDPGNDDTAVIHFTTLPWIHFTSFSHARNLRSADSIPKIAFGRVATDGSRQWMPLSVEVHHALLDGLHVGRFVEHLEADLGDPSRWLP